MLLPTHPRARMRKRWHRPKSGFQPAQISAVRAWYRMAASTAVSGEWETIVDVLGGSSMVQTDADRKLAASTAANGLPTGVFDGSDCMRMPLGANNFSTSKFGLAWWMTPTGLAGGQNYFAIFNNDAAVRVLTFGNSATGKLALTIYIGTNVDGRTYTATDNGSIVSGVSSFVRLQIDMTKTSEFDADGDMTDAKVRIFVNESAIPLTAADFGLGGTLTTLRSPTGSAIWGGLNDSDTPSGPTSSGHVHGPNTYALLDTPTPEQGVLLMGFDPLP